MPTHEEEPARKPLFTWKIILGILSVVVLIGYFSGGFSGKGSGNSPSTTSGSTQKADAGTHMACEHWRINLSNYSVETLAQQIAGAQKVNSYARVSTNSKIVEFGRKMAEDMINQDAEAYLADGTAFANACQSAGE